jgi:glycosyltransferase involved in cell wall biosynthesis
MKILLLMDPFIPIPPIHYGGIERVIYDIACKYVEMGHEITIIAGPNSKSPGNLITYSKNGNGYTKLDFSVLTELYLILKKEIPRHDVIHNFGRLAFLFPVAWTKIVKVQTYMRYITPNNIKCLNRIGGRNITYTAVSEAIVKTGISGGGEWKTVYNCAPIHQFDFVQKVADDAPLVFLGRLDRCKGAHSAIAVAKNTNRKLIIAGNISHLQHELDYFNNEVKPHIDNEQIKYIGVVDNEQKNKLLGIAAAMLLPIEWYEPFPIVLPESFACGTPILAFRNGGVPEGIREGVTGFLSSNVHEMSNHVNDIHVLNRMACRKEAEEKYSDTVIAKEYLKIYNRIE